jgi:hypothetical protein
MDMRRAAILGSVVGVCILAVEAVAVVRLHGQLRDDAAGCAAPAAAAPAPEQSGRLVSGARLPPSGPPGGERSTRFERMSAREEREFRAADQAIAALGLEDQDAEAVRRIVAESASERRTIWTEAVDPRHGPAATTRTTEARRKERAKLEALLGPERARAFDELRRRSEAPDAGRL